MSKDNRDDFEPLVMSEKSFSELYKRYYAILSLFAQRMVEDESIAEDIVQDLFATIWEREVQFINDCSLRVYLYNGVRNRCLDYFRRKNVESKALEKYQTVYMSLEATAECQEEEIYRKLFHFVDQLPARQREIFLLSMQGKKNKSIAEMLNISFETVKVQKRRAMISLRKNLTKTVKIVLTIIYNM